MANKSAHAARVLVLRPSPPVPRVLTVAELRVIRGTLQRLALHAKTVEMATQAYADLALLDEAIEGKRGI